MTYEVSVVHAPVSLVKTNVCLWDQKKQSFLTLAKENQSPLGLYRNPPTFFFTNPHFVLLISDRCFVLISPQRFRVRHFWEAHVQSWPHMSSAWNCFVYNSEHKLDSSDYYILNMDIFLSKTHWFTTEGLCSPLGAVWDTFFFIEGRFLFQVFWTEAMQHPLTEMIELERSKTNFNITPTGFIWKKKVIYT